MSSIPEYSVIEFTINHYNCKWSCYNGGYHYLRISQGTRYHQFNSSSTTAKYMYTNAADIFIEPSPSAVIEFNITYRGEWVYQLMMARVEIFSCIMDNVVDKTLSRPADFVFSIKSETLLNCHYTCNN